MKWLFAVAGLLLLSLVLNLGMLSYTLYVLVLLVLVSRSVAETWVRHLVAHRHCGERTAEVGDVVPVVIEVRNAGPLPVPWLLLDDVLPRAAVQGPSPALEVEGEPAQVIGLARGQQRQFTYRLHCCRRGYYQLGPLVAETGDLFGLFRRYRLLARPHFLLVRPRVVPLEGYELASRRLMGEVRLAHRLYEDPTRIAGVRHYVAGDPFNRVHWRATARTGKLQSKLYEPSSVAGATLLLDFHRLGHDPRQEPVRSELAVTAAASIAHALSQLGHQVGLITNGRDAADRIRQEGWALQWRSRRLARKSTAMLDASDRLRPVVVPTRRGWAQATHILDTLARIELTDGLQLEALVGETQSRMPRDATVIAIVPRVTTEQALVLGSLVRQGFAVTALVNIYDDYDYSLAAVSLLAEGVVPQHLKQEDSVSQICRHYVLR